MERDFLEHGLKGILSGTVVVTVGFFINSVFSYLLQLYLGRHLSISDYGTFSALLALFYLFIVPATVLGTSVVKIVSELYGEDKIPQLSSLYWDLTKKIVLAGLLAVVLMFLFRYRLAAYLNIQQPLLFLFLGLYVFGSFIALTPQAYLQGMLLFKKFAIFSTVIGFLRFTIPAGLVYLGYRVGGAYTGLFIALLVSTFFAFLLFRKDLTKDKNIDIKYLYKKILDFSVPVLLINLGLAAMINMDVLLVKKYFMEDQTGYYAGVVTLGKIILFGAGSVVAVMFPEISALKSAGKKFMHRLKFFSAFQLGLIVPAAAIFMLFPGFITNLFFGSRFSNSVQYLPLFSIFISLYVLVSFLMRFFLAIGKTNVYALLIAPIALQFICLNLYHQSLYQVIWINTGAVIMLLVSLLIYLYKISTDIAPS